MGNLSSAAARQSEVEGPTAQGSSQRRSEQHQPQHQHQQTHPTPQQTHPTPQQSREQRSRNTPGGSYPGASHVGMYPGAQFDIMIRQGLDHHRLALPQVQQLFLEGMRLPSDFSRQRLPTPQPQIQKTFTIRNDVNLKRGSLQLIQDTLIPHLYYVEFDFDASRPCAISVHYAATVSLCAETGELTFAPLRPETTHAPIQYPSGMCHHFRAKLPLDTTLYEVGDLESPSDLKFPEAKKRGGGRHSRGGALYSLRPLCFGYEMAPAMVCQ